MQARLTSVKSRICGRALVCTVLATLSCHVHGHVRVGTEGTVWSERAIVTGEGEVCRFIRLRVIGIQYGDANLIK